MSATDDFTANDRPFSPSTQDDSSIDSSRTTQRNPRRNPYNQRKQHKSSPLTNQQLYTATHSTTQHSITKWLIGTTTPVTHNQTEKLPHLPTTKLRTKRQPQRNIQTPLHALLDNDHWGDAPTKNPIHFRVISKNVNSLSTNDNNLQWRGAVQAMVDMDAHILCLQEPNLNWTDNLRQPIYRLFQKAFMHAKITTSSSTHSNGGSYQPGGTFLATLGCYAARVVSTGTDTTGMGRWAYHELIGKNTKRYIIITAYRVGTQRPTIGTNTACTQQYNILLEHGVLAPNPREQFVTDIITFVQRWQTTHEILLCLDANDNTTESRDKGIERILDETALIDLHHHRHPGLQPPATHHRGRLTIDYCLGTRGFAQALTAAWMLSFGLPPTLSGDHRTLGLEFDHDILFGCKVPMTTPTPQRGIYSTAYQTVRKFNDMVAQACQQHNLYNGARRLAAKYIFTEKDHDDLEQLDQQLTTILVRTDKKLAKYRTAPWSPELHKAFLTHRFWTVSLTQERTRRDYSTALKLIESQMKNPPNTNGSISCNLRKAQQEIREIKRAAAQRREAYLQELLDDANQTNDKSRQRLIKHLRMAEYNRKCFALHRQFMKPRTAGGLTRLLVPDDNDSNKWKTLINPPDMEHSLIDYCQQHFSEAHGTPYTIPPLSDLLKPDSLTPFGRQVLNGTADLPRLTISYHTKLLLQHQQAWQQSHLPRFHDITFDDMIAGFRKWTERTSTSPSGRHLGIYKSLIKDANKKKPKQTKKTNKATTKQQPPEYNGKHVLQLIHQLISMAIQHCHTYDRWRTIWNLFLEKDIGIPKITKLRALHIVEADYNLLLKWFGPKGFIKRAEDHRKLTPYQGGGRHGRSAIDLACKKVAAYDYITITRTTAANFEYDLKQCFDNMNEVCTNLSCLQHGADPRYIRLHAQTQSQQRYHVKHAYGISKHYNQHSDEHPWYGAGQGTGDAAPRWVVLSNSLINAYHAEAGVWHLPDPISTKSVPMGIDAYMDDTNQVMGEDCITLDPILPEAQRNIDLWQGLIQASGGTLNPTKCSWTPFQWEFDKLGNARLVEPPDQPKYHITAMDRDGHRHTLVRNTPQTAVRLLGVQIAADGNYTTEYSTLQKRQAQYSVFLQRTPMTRREAGVIYRQCYLPKVTYPLPATTIPPDKLYQSQLRVTSQFLNKMGYPITFPRAVVYAPRDVGGLGFRHLGHEQGVQHVLQLLKQLRTTSLNGQLYRTVIDAYQIRAGCARPILEYTDTLAWCPKGWMTTTRQFMHSIKATIELQQPWVPLPRREYDRNIMDDVHSRLPHADLAAINNVRLYLKVFFLSEITDANGTTILSHVIDNGPSRSCSTLQWPRQPLPTPEAWKHWRRAIQALYLKTNSDRLITPLKDWNANANKEWNWEWRIDPNTKVLYQWNGRHWTSRRPVLAKRTYIAYEAQAHQRANITPESLSPATPSYDSSGTFIIVLLPIYSSTRLPQQSPTAIDDILERLSTPPEEWAMPLWHRIRPMAAVDALLTLLQKQQPLIISSDASVDAAKHSCCAWTIHGTTALWQGEGIIPGNCDDTYSGRSEAFGILTALLFLLHYMHQYPLTQPTKQASLTVYCDNGGTITKATEQANLTEIFPNQTITDDYDVYNEIGQAVRSLTHFKVTFVHVKGHQDRRAVKQPLSLPARLNIECDERAARFISAARRTRQQDNPALPHSYPHLRIHGNIIVREFSQALRHAATTPDYRDYLKEKFHWNDTECDDINWTSLKYALHKLTPSDTTRAHKFLHEWLPLKGAPQTSSPEASTLCPQCRREEETMWHFWECNQVEREQRYRKLHTDLNALHTQHHIDPHLFQLLWQGLQAIRTDTTIDEQYISYPDDIKPLFYAQRSIGWDQLYHGRISSTWAHQVTINSQYKTNGIVFYAKVIGLIWQYVLDCWKQRNQHLHASDRLPPDYHVLEAQVRHIVDTAKNEPALANVAPTLTVEQIMHQPLPRIRGWAQRGAQHVHNYLTAAHKRAVLHTQDIRNFFRPRHNPDLRPP